MIVNQTVFRTALLDPDRARPDGLCDGAGRQAGRRFDVYRNNVAVSLTEALETAFPVLLKLLGETNFRIMASIFLRKHPPASPLMMFYGAEMPGFLSDFEPTSRIGYLPDVARLELALRESYHAADTDGIDPNVLQSIPTERLMASHIGLAPSLRLLRSQWPIHAIWKFNAVPGAPKPTMEAQDVVVLRHGFDPEPHQLHAGGGAFIEALSYDLSLAEAIDQASAASTDFELTEILALLISTGSIISIGDKP